MLLPLLRLYMARAMYGKWEESGWGEEIRTESPKDGRRKNISVTLKEP